MNRVSLELGPRSYDIIIGKGVIKDLSCYLPHLGLEGSPVVITNKRIFGLYGNLLNGILKRGGFKPVIIEVPDSERSKSFREVSRLLAKLVKIDKGRGIFVISFGGGVIGDLSGFVASIYKRGIPYIQIPTTFLSQIDSSIGGKTAIDLSEGKNLVGAFYQPKLVLSDISFLKSLSLKQMRDGMAELIKYGIISDRTFFEYTEEHFQDILDMQELVLLSVVTTAARIKADIVSRDERDAKDVRIVLNCGHTIAHAIEAAFEYSNECSHGEAVAIGLVSAARISERIGIIDKMSVERIENLIEKVGLPTHIKGVRVSRIMKAQVYDKKVLKGKNRYLLPVGIGHVIVRENVPEGIIKEVLNRKKKKV